LYEGGGQHRGNSARPRERAPKNTNAKKRPGPAVEGFISKTRKKKKRMKLHDGKDGRNQLGRRSEKFQKVRKGVPARLPLGEGTGGERGPGGSWSNKGGKRGRKKF